VNKKLILQAVMGFIAFGIWTFLVYTDPSLKTAYTAFVVSVVTTLAALVLRDMPTEQKPAEPKPLPDPQPKEQQP
jgi:hypothetical protein